jgi:hypothetical protein
LITKPIDNNNSDPFKRLPKCSLVLGGDELTNPLNLPSFKWLSNLSPGGVPLLDVHFPDGGPDDTVVLSKSNPIPPQVLLTTSLGKYTLDEIISFKTKQN